jgi:hypothetical protein
VERPRGRLGERFGSVLEALDPGAELAGHPGQLPCGLPCLRHPFGVMSAAVATPLIFEAISPLPVAASPTLRFIPEYP